LTSVSPCLEDIKAPECFEVERICRETMGIPVFHDDQHGTAAGAYTRPFFSST
jgi:malic enzyme